MKTLIGIDWSQAHHDVRIHNEGGACLARFQIAHSLAGFEQLVKQISRINPEPSHCLLAIETADNLLIDFLGSQPYRLYVLAPSFVNGNRGRQRTSGARNDDSDAALLADILRTDYHRLIPWQPDGPLVRQMRLLLSFVDDLTTSIVQYHNRLQANLRRYYPQALAAFAKVSSPLCLHFLIAYPTPAAATALAYPAFDAFCQQHRDTRPDYRPQRYARLQQPTPPADESLLAAFERQTPWLAQLLLNLVQQKQTAITQLQTLFHSHPDHPIFASLPGAGDLLAPKLLVMFGDHRSRLPSAAFIQALTGSCPVTVKSGKSHTVRFRRACNHAYRTTAQQFAIASTAQSPWAATYFDNARRRGLPPSHAYRCLANRWLNIIWTLWQRQQPYDEQYHWQQLHQQHSLATKPAPSKQSSGFVSS
jgi:transposase